MKLTKPKKVLILGSGALKIGEAGEFDYSGSQAIKALKDEGIKTVLINPNIATIQTSENMADQVYFLPVTEFFVEQVIQKEKPDAIMISFGGQTALNCGIRLHKKGIFKKYDLKVLGTSIQSVIISEDREKFAQHLRKIGIKTPQSKAANTIKEAKKIATEIGYPVMIRAAFALGGQKSGVAATEAILEQMVTDALSFSPQVLIEKYLHHFKEIEYEVVRDIYDNCVTVCNMENMDPLGIHTGESVVVAPSQTLNNTEYHTLRKISIDLVRSLNILGECNVQFALNPEPKKGELDYYVIELNPRLSRSSALASKATGYPLAYVATKLILGKGLLEIQNQVTKVTQSAFEPALDYLVVKLPRWDLEKFNNVTHVIGSSMKSVGEVMAIGRNFEEAIQKAIRMLDINADGIIENNFPKEKKEFDKLLTVATPKRLFALAEALRRDYTVDQLHAVTGIDEWFLHRIQDIVIAYKNLARTKNTSEKKLRTLKQLGFSDKTIAKTVGSKELVIRKKRKKLHITPSVFQIDTLAGEVPAKTNYLYMTYLGNHHDIQPTGKNGVIILGSGTYRIGSSVEFDWTCVNTAQFLKKHKKSTILVNCNPETVSTDYDMSDKLYFEELTFERVADIYDFEKSEGVIISVGGQTPNNLASKLHNYRIPILGTKAVNIDRAEDRSKFSALLDSLEIKQPEWAKFVSTEKAIEFAEKVGYPVLIRPSYVLSGNAMNVCFTQEELREYIDRAVILNSEYPITVSKFISGAREIEVDAIAQKGNIRVLTISEHIENAGVHSGDASIMYPPEKMYVGTEMKIKDISAKIAKALSITGPFNIQFLAKNNKVQVIEVNLRSSRTFPFISKATGINYAEVLVDSLYGKAKKIHIDYPDYSVVKVPQFSFSRLEGADPILRVEMASTGEAACFGDSLEEAFLKAELAVGGKVPQKGIFVSIASEVDKIIFLPYLYELQKLGLPFYATEKTSAMLKKNGIKAKRLYKIQDKKTPNVLTYVQKGVIDFAIVLTDPYAKKDWDDYYKIRRAVVDHNIYLLTDRQKAQLFISALNSVKLKEIPVKSWKEYNPNS